MNTYPEMNEQIVSILRISEEPAPLYAAQRITELESLVKRYKAALEEVWRQGGSLKFFDITDRESGVQTYGIKQRDTSGVLITRSRGCDTPLDAIEAAMNRVEKS